MSSVRLNIHSYVFIIGFVILLILLYSVNTFINSTNSYDQSYDLVDTPDFEKTRWREDAPKPTWTQPDTNIDPHPNGINRVQYIETTTSIDDDLTSATIATSTDNTSKNKKFNVLFLVADDLRPQLESYRGRNYPNPYSTLSMHTPNLDDFAKKSLQLNRAYVQFSVCNPSRASYMTSRRPDTTQVWDLRTFWRKAGGNFTTIPQYFKERGYRSAGFGKIYHPGKGGGNKDVPLSWSERYYVDPNGRFYQLINCSWWAVPEELSASKPLHDEGVTAAAINLLEALAPSARSGKEQFFVAVGFQKPHIPFVFPERYLKYYPLENMDLARNRYVPNNFPSIAWFHIDGSRYDDIRRTNIRGVFNETLPDDAAMLYRRAYFACVTFVDDMVGRLLKTLDDLDLTRDTIVTFIGDHGFHLGENGMWGKHTNMEQATHAPMMIHVPGRTDRGIQSNSIVEFLDLFPTIVEAAGLEPVPLCPDNSGKILTCTEGRSFARLLDDPDETFKQYALSQIPRFGHMGYTLCDDRYRYVEWVPLVKHSLGEHSCSSELIWDKVIDRELYDHSIDPDENNNVVHEATSALTVKQMSNDLRTMIKTPITTHC